MKEDDEFAVGLVPATCSLGKYRELNYVQQPSIIRLGILLLLFDVYLTWARIERQSVPDAADSTNESNFGRLAQQPIVFQYMFFCTSPRPNIHTSTHPYSPPSAS